MVNVRYIGVAINSVGGCGGNVKKGSEWPLSLGLACEFKTREELERNIHREETGEASEFIPVLHSSSITNSQAEDVVEALSVVMVTNGGVFDLLKDRGKVESVCWCLLLEKCEASVSVCSEPFNTSNLTSAQLNSTQLNSNLH
ncbi:hypothetical protein QVD17_05474 [Tagetes erecta]|uniref:Uncharacterized protein n=1 Tax=Tagetes erecta TaxID=13708 RepID=A0AAD8PB68_TARER|nr:hypothetical protein QVD17_05474 [Tagetes erecta]